MNEKLSAFIDNELSELEQRQVMAELGRDETLRTAWGRYHLIGAALRKNAEHVVSADLATRVATAIAREPAQRQRSFALRFGRAAGGLAIAASVATLAIINFPSLTSTHPEAATVAKTAPGTPGATATTVATRPSAAVNRLNAYLVEHNEFAPTAGMSNMLPYVRTVSHDDNR